LAARARTALAFAPATISNFFSIHDDPILLKDYSRLDEAGATGGGYILSKGVASRATRFNGSDDRDIRITVNGDATYPAKTTMMALRMLVNETAARFGTLVVEQRVDVPIGHGFGASAASALSGVLAASAALGLNLSKRKTAHFAHMADILSQTGLGTVSVIYRGTGAGAITKAGGPGVARFLNVKTPTELRIVTASLAPYAKSTALSSEKLRERINRFGDEALRRVEADPSLDTLAQSGSWFADNVGLKTKQVARLVEKAKSSGAIYASQNMIGYAIHALVMESEIPRVVRALSSTESMPRVEVYEVGSERAGVRPGAEEWLYPTVTRSLV
jgi:pantoate kinase